MVRGTKDHDISARDEAAARSWSPLARHHSIRRSVASNHLGLQSFGNDDLHFPFSPQHVDAYVLIVANEQQINRRISYGQIVNPQFA